MSSPRARPSGPSFVGGIASITRMSLVRAIRGKKLRLGLAAIILVLAASAAAAYSGDGDKAEIFDACVFWGFFHLLAFLLPFLFSSGAIAEEVEGRTLSFLTMRPVGRFSVVVGKYLAATALSAGLIGAGMLILHGIVYATDPTMLVEKLTATLRLGGSLVYLSACYCAICMLWGALIVEASGLMAILHLAVIEVGFAKLPGAVRFISMGYLARLLGGMGVEEGILADTVPEIPLWASAAPIGFELLGAIALAAFVVQVSEFRFSKA